MRQRELASFGQEILGQCERVTTALVPVNSDDDLLEHRDTSWASR
jgi:hypothetical protein